MTPNKRERLRALIQLPAHHSDWEFTSVLFSRPINYLLLHLVGGVRCITPNLLTVLGFLSFVGASAFLVFAPLKIYAIAGLLVARLLLDDMDGMLARYRGGGSKLGSYLDKITDVIGFFLFFSALGYRAFLLTGSWYYLLVAHGATFGLLTTGYVKWVVHAMQGPAQVRHLAPSSLFPRKPWWRVFLVLLFLKLPILNECDIFPLSIFLLFLGKPHWLLLILAATQLLQMAGMVVARGLAAHHLDQG